MSTDNDPYVNASIDALRAAVRSIHGDPTAVADIDNALHRLYGTPHPVAHMGGWAAAVQHVQPLPEGARYALAAIDPTVSSIDQAGERPEAVLGMRLVAALLNDDHDNACALWSTAVNQGHDDYVIVLVLRQMATMLAPHMPAEEARTDG